MTLPVTYAVVPSIIGGLGMATILSWGPNAHNISVFTMFAGSAAFGVLCLFWFTPDPEEKKLEL